MAGQEAFKRVLVIEDDRSARAALVDLLSDEGFDVHEAATGAEALAVLDRAPPSVALVDYLLPDIDGASLIRAIRTRLDGCACIMVTGSADLRIDEHGDAQFSDRASEAEEAGAAGYVAKPVDFDELLRVLRRVLQ